MIKVSCISPFFSSVPPVWSLCYKYPFEEILKIFNVHLTNLFGGSWGFMLTRLRHSAHLSCLGRVHSSYNLQGVGLLEHHTPHRTALLSEENWIPFISPLFHFLIILFNTTWDKNYIKRGSVLSLWAAVQWCLWHPLLGTCWGLFPEGHVGAVGKRCNSVSLRPTARPLPKLQLGFFFFICHKNQTSPKIKCLRLGFQFEPCCHCKCAEWSPCIVYTQHRCLKIKIKMEKLVKMSSNFSETSIKAWSLSPNSAFGPVEICSDNRLSSRKQFLWQNSGTSSSLFVF